MGQQMSSNALISRNPFNGFAVIHDSSLYSVNQLTFLALNHSNDSLPGIRKAQQLRSSSILRLAAIKEVSKSTFCSSSISINLVFEYQSKSLDDALRERRAVGKTMCQKQLKQIAKGLTIAYKNALPLFGNKNSFFADFQTVVFVNNSIKVIHPSIANAIAQCNSLPSINHQGFTLNQSLNHAAQLVRLILGCASLEGSNLSHHYTQLHRVNQETKGPLRNICKQGLSWHQSIQTYLEFVLNQLSPAQKLEKKNSEIFNLERSVLSVTSRPASANDVKVPSRIILKKPLSNLEFEESCFLQSESKPQSFIRDFGQALKEDKTVFPQVAITVSSLPFIQSVKPVRQTQSKLIPLPLLRISSLSKLSQSKQTTLSKDLQQVSIKPVSPIIKKIQRIDHLKQQPSTLKRVSRTIQKSALLQNFPLASAVSQFAKDPQDVHSLCEQALPQPLSSFSRPQQVLPPKQNLTQEEFQELGYLDREKAYFVVEREGDSVFQGWKIKGKKIQYF